MSSIVALSNREAAYLSKISVGFVIEQASEVMYRCTVKFQACLSVQNTGRLRDIAGEQCHVSLHYRIVRLPICLKYRSAS